MLLLVLFIDDQALNTRNALEQKAKVKKKTKNKNKNKSNNNMHIREEKIIVQGKGKHG